MKNALLPVSRALLALAAGLAFLAGPALASAAPPVANEYRIRDSGQNRVFDVSRTEVWVQVGRQAKELRKINPVATPQAAVAAAEAMQAALGQPVGLVLTERDAPESDFARALLTREVLARLVPPADAQALATVLGAVSVEPAIVGGGWWLFTAEGITGSPALAEALRQQPGVTEAQPQLARTRQLFFVPNDELFTNQWHLVNTGQAGATPGMDVAVSNVWNTLKGDGVVIGIIDGGLEGTHPDLAPNMVAGLGYDFLDGDNDPSPANSNDNHGTAVGGVAAAKGNNTEGVSGAAFNSGLVSLRLIGGAFTDATEASAFLYENQTIDIKNNSWGPGADYARVVGPGPVSLEALRLGAELGRSGRGVIYTFASGNSRQEYGNANFNGNANSRYTIAVTGCDDQGNIVSYATPGSCVVVASPTGDSGLGRLDITTTDRTGTNGYNPDYLPPPANYTNLDYTSTFNGTSSACPLASGVIALILEANPNLGWRDVQEILMRSARVISTNSPSWQTNSAGFHFNYDFGAGMVQAEAGVELAYDWVNLVPETNVVYAVSNLAMIIPDNNPNGVSFDFMVGDPNLRIEHVQLGVNLTHRYRGDLEITLTSPSGIVSRLGTPRPYDPSPDLDWTFMTVFNWGEDSVGRWVVNVSDRVVRDTGVLNDLTLTIYGVPREAPPDATATELSVRVVDAPDPVLVGNTLTYSVTITNAGMNTSSNIVVEQSLPTGTVFLSGSSPDGAVVEVAGLVTWNPKDLAPGGSASMTVRVLTAVASTLFSTVTATNSTRDSNPANNIFIVSSRVLPLTADLGLTLSDTPDPALVGGTLTYNLTVTNRGPSTAAGTIVTATLPSTVSILSANASQGTSSTVSNVVTFVLGGVNSSSMASMSIACRPLAPGNLLATAKVTSNLPDPITANNTASTSTAINPASDLVVTLADYPDPAVLRSNFYYSITVANRGPNPANSVTVNQTIPAGVKVVSNFTSQGTVSILGNGGTVISSLGTLVVGATANLVITAAGTNVGTFLSSVTAASAQTDADLANNTASVTTVVALPFISVVPAGATLKSESLATNGAIDIGELVSVEFRLRNAGNVPNTNLVATLLPGGGVTLVTSSPQSYGVLLPGGLPRGATFGFTATGTNGGTVTARLQLRDNGVIIGTNVFTFALPNLISPANLTPIVINDNAKASPYPSTLSVSRLGGVVSKVTVTLSNLSHTFPDDMQVLLTGPGGNQVMLMANAGGGAEFSGATIKFDDAAPPMGDDGNVGATSYRPSSYGTVGSLPAPAPGIPYADNLAVFNGLVPNGTWSLFVVDSAAGDFGLIAGGWSLQIYTVIAVNALADLGLTAAATPNPVLVGSPLTFTYTLTNAGPDAANGVMLTNLQPANVALVSATSDLGVCTTNGNLVTCIIPTLAAASRATVTVVVKPLAPGTIAASASVTSAEVDLNAGNNQASAEVTAQLPVADLAVTLEPPASLAVVLGSNVTYTITVTNLGPENALGAALVNRLGAFNTNDFEVVALTNSSGTAESVSNHVVLAAWGDLLPKAGGTVSVTLQARALGWFTNTVTATTGSTDAVTDNNQAMFILSVVPPMPKVVAAGATLLAESYQPANGTVEPGETVTVSLALQNEGELTASNGVATLAASGGITAPSGAQTYGELAPGAAPIARPFTFTAVGVGPYTATLQLTNGGVHLGSVVFTFDPPTTESAANEDSIFIPEIGTSFPYPSTLPVSELMGVISQVTVTLTNFSHTFPDDVDVLLVSPAGTKLVLMSDVGGNHSVSNITLTFADAALASLPDSGPLVSGTYRPTDYEPDDLFVSPAPEGPLAPNLAAYNGEDPNGSWRLFVSDDSAGDRGSIAGWSLNFTLVQPLNPVAGLSVTLAAEPVAATTWQKVTLATVVANAGPANAAVVNLTNLLPAGLKFISASAPQGKWTNTPAGVVFTLGQMDAGTELQVTVVAQPVAAGAQTVQAMVTGLGSTDLNLADNSDAVVVVTVAPPPAPVLAAQYEAGVFTLHLSGQPNATYSLESSTTLPGTWSPVETLTTDDQGNASWSAPDTQLSPYFYRTVQNP
jgi:uncharacterized repeat protein (TIGR01451 family)